MEKISFEQFKNKLKQGEKDFTNLILENMNLENYDLSGARQLMPWYLLVDQIKF